MIKLKLKLVPEYIWLWVAIESETKNILGIGISKERNMFVVERFLSNVIKDYGEHPVSTDGGTSFEKSIIEWTRQYIKDRTEGFDDYFPCRKEM